MNEIKQNVTYIIRDKMAIPKYKMFTEGNNDGINLDIGDFFDHLKKTYMEKAARGEAFEISITSDEMGENDKAQKRLDFHDHYNMEVNASHLIIYNFKENGDLPPITITKTERLLIPFFCKGLSDKDISNESNYSAEAAHNHRNRLALKLGTHTIIQMMIACVERGLYIPDKAFIKVLKKGKKK